MKCLYWTAALVQILVSADQALRQQRPGLAETTRTFAIRPGALVQLRDIPGPVYITTGERTSVVVRFDPLATGGTPSDAGLDIAHLPDRLSLSGSSIGLTDSPRIRVHLSAPVGVRLEIVNVRGELQMQGTLRGALSAADIAGSLRLETVEGPLFLQRIHGAVVAALEGTEPAEITGVSGSVTLTVSNLGEVVVPTGAPPVRIHGYTEPHREQRGQDEVLAFSPVGRRVHISGVVGSVAIARKQ